MRRLPPRCTLFPYTTLFRSAQAYLYLTKELGGAPVGFGSDFNGFAGLPSPRFGAEACHGGSSAAQVARTSYPLSIAVENSVTKDRKSTRLNSSSHVNLVCRL